MQAARNLDLFWHPAIGLLPDLRAASCLTGRRDAGDHVPATFRVEDMTRYGWDLSVRTPPRSSLARSAVPGRRLGPQPARRSRRPGFAAYSKPGYANVAISLRVDPRGTTSSFLTMETQVALTDDASLRRYWMVIGPFRPCP